MTLFKFQDSNFLNGYNNPNVKAIADTYNGYQFNVSADTQVLVPNVASAKLGNMYVMCNIIDKPEIINTSDYKVKAGEYIRAFRLKDFVGQKLEMSADLVTTAFADVAVGDNLVPQEDTGDGDGDGNSPMKWIKSASAAQFTIYLKVIKKTTFGAFTVDAAGGTVAGGYVVEVMANVL